MKEKVKMYSTKVKKENYAKIEAQKKANKRPGMYRQMMLERVQMQKSKENNLERAKRRELRQKKNEEEKERFETEKQLKTLFNMHKEDRQKSSNDAKVWFRD